MGILNHIFYYGTIFKFQSIIMSLIKVYIFFFIKIVQNDLFSKNLNDNYSKSLSHLH